MGEGEADKRDAYLSEAISRLTEENQRYFLGVLQALLFAQNEKDISPDELAYYEGEFDRAFKGVGIES